MSDISVAAGADDSGRQSSPMSAADYGWKQRFLALQAEWKDAAEKAEEERLAHATHLQHLTEMVEQLLDVKSSLEGKLAERNDALQEAEQRCAALETSGDTLRQLLVTVLPNATERQRRSAHEQRFWDELATEELLRDSRPPESYKLDSLAHAEMSLVGKMEQLRSRCKRLTADNHKLQQRVAELEKERMELHVGKNRARREASALLQRRERQLRGAVRRIKFVLEKNKSLEEKMKERADYINKLERGLLRHSMDASMRSGRRRRSSAASSAASTPRSRSRPSSRSRSRPSSAPRQRPRSHHEASTGKENGKRRSATPGRRSRRPSAVLSVHRPRRASFSSIAADGSSASGREGAISPTELHAALQAASRASHKAASGKDGRRRSSGGDEAGEPGDELALSDGSVHSAASHVHLWLPADESGVAAAADSASWLPDDYSSRGASPTPSMGEEAARRGSSRKPSAAAAGGRRKTSSSSSSRGADMRSLYDSLIDEAEVEAGDSVALDDDTLGVSPELAEQLTKSFMASF
eukprot:PLAT14780.1.p1 GENE.PLAT14780.1~~PLAT14780.1.p1  ORF type:complete len:570 (+),score=186.80 PLAT14780.1:131-1711(+)